MNIETFPHAASTPVPHVVRAEPRFFDIGQTWELRLVAEAYDILGTSNLIISDALAFLVDRLVHGAEIDRFVMLLDDSDHSEVFIADHLVEDLREGCALLIHAIAYDQLLSDAPRILPSAADLARKACHRIYNQLRRH
jgi:hypothetical protein